MTTNLIMRSGLAVCLTVSCLAGRATAGTCGSAAGQDKDIVDTAIAAGNFKTLVAAVQAAGLVDTLRSSGPFTVFAPSDEAFAKLPQSTLNALLQQPQQLGAILKYHVVPGRLAAADVVGSKTLKTALGQSLTVDTSNGVRIGNAGVVQTDIATSNGIIHVIDTVLMPANDIIETARNAGTFKTLTAALEAADLTDALRGTGPFTVFAPTDDAFAKLPAGTVDALLKDIPKLRSILTYHVVPGRVTAKDVAHLQSAKTLQGGEVRIDTTSGVMINDARVVKADIMTDNGVIHVVDRVILPE